MQIFAASGDRRAQVAGRQVPLKVVGVLEQCLIQRLHGLWVRVVNGRVAMGVRQNERLQPRARRDQPGEVVAGPKPVPLV